MLDWMAQSQYLAQGDAEEWINILFIVAVAVFWAIGGLIKAAGAKKKRPQKQPEDRRPPSDRQKQESWQQRLARKAQEFQRAAEEHVRKIEEQARSQHEPQPHPEESESDGGRVTVRSGRGGDSVLVYEPEGADRRQAPQERQQPASPREARQAVSRRREAASRRHSRERSPELPKTEPPPSLSSTPHMPLRTSEGPRPLRIYESMPKQPMEAISTASSWVDYSDPEALRRAILQYEILGKPLSLREPLDRTSAF